MKDTENKLTSGQRVSKCRKAHVPKLTQEALAEIIGCTTQTISNIENDRTALEFEKAYKLAAVFGVSAEYLQAKTENKHYKGDVELAISKMQRYVAMQDDFIEYICLNTDIDESCLSENDKKTLIRDVEWYAEVRLKRLIQEKGEGNVQKGKQGK